MPHKYWYCGTFDFKKVSKTGLYPNSTNIQAYIMPYQQEIKREHSEHLISPDMATKESNLQRRLDYFNSSSTSTKQAGSLTPFHPHTCL